MIDREFLDKWIKIIIPKEYGPDKRLENKKPLLSVTLFPNEDMDKFKNKFYPDADEKTTLGGHLVDFGSFMEFVGAEDYKRYAGRYLIRINADLTEEQAIYALLHEEAHLHYFVTKNKKHAEMSDMSEEMADNKALKRCKELIKDKTLAFKVMLEGLTYKL